MLTVVETTQASESPFTPKVKAKLAANVEKASCDFRSDVVTVPTEDMMCV
jgi:threonine aldolase